MGRPPKPIDWETVKKLAALQCTRGEIAAFLGISVDTLQRRKSSAGIITEGQEAAKVSLRRWQWARAEAGSDRMLEWLGIQYLGQTSRMFSTVEQLPVKVILKLPEYENPNGQSANG